MAGSPSPIPTGPLAAFSRQLSATADAASFATACGVSPPPSVADAVPCDLDLIEVTVKSNKGKTSTRVAVPARAMAPRSQVMDVVCGVRPQGNAGAGQAEDPKRLTLVRDPARITVNASYAATCGRPHHPGIRIDPRGGDSEICEPRTIPGTSATFEAFRLRTGVERSKQWLKGPALLPVISGIWAMVDEDSSTSSLTIRSDSCGIRASGPCIGAALLTLNLHSEDEVALTFKMPPLLGRTRSREWKSGSEQGELRVGRDGSKEADTSGSSYQREQHDQAGASYEKKSYSRSVSGGQTSASFKRESGSHAEPPKLDGAPSNRLGLAEQKAHALKELGYDFSFSHNGDQFGLADLQSALAFFELSASVSRVVGRFRDLWEAGPGVKACVGWSASWSLQFFEASGSARWTRKLPGSVIVRTAEASSAVTLVSGSAKASFGLVVVVQRLTVEWVNIDYSVSLTLAGAISGATVYSAQRKGDAAWSVLPKQEVIKGEVKLALKATGKVTLCGRIVGTELAVESGLEGEAVIDPAKGFGFQKASLSRKPVVFSVSVWVGSTGEVDHRYEQEIFGGADPWVVHPAQAVGEGE